MCPVQAAVTIPPIQKLVPVSAFGKSLTIISAYAGVRLTLSCHRLMDFARLFAFVLAWWITSSLAVASTTNFAVTAFEVLATKAPCSGPLPASTHPYANGMNAHWTNTCAGARAVEIVFGERTKLEWLYDFVHITDARGTNVRGSPFTGDQLAGQTLVVPGDTVIVRLETDGAIADWGFEVRSVTGLSSSSQSNPVALSQQSLTLFWQVQHGGIQVGENWWFDMAYFSDRPTWDETAKPIGSGFLPQTWALDDHYSQWLTVEIPPHPAGDDYYLILRTDAGDRYPESIESDNELSVPLHLGDTDLAAINLNAPTIAAPQQRISITWTGANVGLTTAFPYWYDYVNVGNGPYSRTVEWVVRENPLSSGMVYGVTRAFALPSLPAGAHPLEVHVNESGISELNSTNNVLATSITIVPPDLATLTVDGPADVIAGEWFTVSFTVSNASSVPAYPSWSDVAYLSSTNQLTAEALRVGECSHATALLPGMSYVQSFLLNLPAERTGNMFLLLRTDADTNLFNANASNDVVALPLHISAADLAVTRFEAYPNPRVAPNTPLNFSWTVENRGPGAARSHRLDRIFLVSTSETIGIVAEVHSSWEIEPIQSGATYSRAVTARTPIVPPGEYLLVLQTDSAYSQSEADESNNTSSIPITITTSGLIVEAIDAPTLISAQEPFEVVWLVRNLSVEPAYPPWDDTVVITSPAAPNEPLATLARVSINNVLGPGQTYTQTQKVTVSSLGPGEYLLVASTGPAMPVSDPLTNRNAAALVSLQGSDLVALTIAAPPTGLLQSNALAAVRILNLGPADAFGPFYVQFYISPTNRWVPAAVHVGSAQVLDSLLLGVSTVVTGELHFAVDVPEYYFLIAVIDSAQVSDPDPINNEVFTSILVQGADLLPESFGAVSAPAGARVHAAAQQPIDLQWVVGNHDFVPTLRGWRDTIIFMTRGSFPVELGTAAWVQSLQPGESYLQNKTVTLPSAKPGLHELLLRVDSGFEVEETSEVNNTTSIEVDIVSPDLAMVDLEASAIADGTFEVRWRVANVGHVDAFPGWVDTLYISATNHITAAAIPISSMPRSAMLATNNSYAVTQHVALPLIDAGDYYLIAYTDAATALYDPMTYNNGMAVRINIAKPDLIPMALYGTPVPLPPQSTISLSYTVQNSGPGRAAPAWRDRVFFSRDGVIDLNDILLGDFSGGESVMGVGDTYTKTETVKLPPALAGNHFLLLQVNADNHLAESDLGDNTIALSISVAAMDLELTDLATSNQAAPKQRISIAWSVRNNGPVEAFPAWQDSLYLSTSPVWNAGAIFLGATQSRETLEPGSNYTASLTVAIPTVQPGNYYLLARADSGRNLSDSNILNNAQVVPIRIVLPDLAAVHFSQLQPSGICEGPFPESPNPAPAGALLRWTNACAGASSVQLTFDAASYLTYNSSFISIMDKDGVPIPGSPFTGLIHPARKLIPGDTVIIELSTGFVGSNYFRITDVSGMVESTNLFASPQGDIDVTWTISNLGLGAAAAGWSGEFYLSEDVSLDSSDIVLKDFQTQQSLAAGSECRQSMTLRMSAVPPGPYYLVLKIDDTAYNQGIAFNNVLSVPIIVGPPADLRPTALIAPASIDADHLFPVINVAWTITNQGAASAAPSWVDNLYLSRDMQLDPGDRKLASIPRIDGLDPGRAYTRTQSVTLHIDEPGRYHLLVWADAPDACESGCVYETDETNNVLSVTLQATLTLPDLVVKELIVPPLLVSSHESPGIEVRWVVQNQGPGAVVNPWSDSLYINGERVLASSREAPLSPGQSYTNSVIHYLTGPFSTQYAVTIETDDPNDCNCVPELSDSNNASSGSFLHARSPRELVLPGEVSSVPLWLSTPAAVDVVDFALLAPPDRVSNLTTSDGLASVGLSQHGNGQYHGRIEARLGQQLSGRQQIGRLHFHALPGQDSCFVTLAVSNVLARDKEGIVVPRVVVNAGRIVILGSRPLLDATLMSSSHHVITVYGLPASNVVLQSKETVGGGEWLDLWQGTLTNRFQTIGPLTAPSETRFYRAHY